MKHWLFVFVSGMLLSACGRPTPLAPLKITGFELRAENLEQLATWYEDHLGLTMSRDEPGISLKGNALQITLKPAASLEGEQLIKGRSPGFFKIGFRTHQLEQLFETLQASGSRFRGDIYFDNNLKTRSFIALDPEGNRVQFFEDATVNQITPYFFAFMALDFDNTLAWCETALGFTEKANLDLPDRGLSIRLMQKDDVLLELIGDANMEQKEAAPRGIGSVILNRTGKRMGDNPLVFNFAD